MPLVRARSMKPFSSSRSVIPTLKSPAVARRGVYGVALDDDADQLAALLPGAREDRDARPERLVRRRRRLVAVREVVDQLLDPHRVRLRQDVAAERGPHEGIGRGVDVDREGRNRRLADEPERIIRRAGELIAPDRFARRAPNPVPPSPAQDGHPPRRRPPPPPP